MSDFPVTIQRGPGPQSQATPEEVASLVVNLFNEHGHSEYGGERVTQLEHALQCAHLAEVNGAKPALVVACLLHDIGHLLHALPEDAPETGIDDLHEELAGQWLGQRFLPEVVEPVRLHVAAKRFLCATDPVYFNQLSPPSQLSLKLQGGPMSTSEVGEFLANPHYRDAVALRRWDDEAKIVGMRTPAVEHFAQAIMACVTQ